MISFLYQRLSKPIIIWLEDELEKLNKELDIVVNNANMAIKFLQFFPSEDKIKDDEIFQKVMNNCIGRKKQIWKKIRKITYIKRLMS